MKIKLNHFRLNRIPNYLHNQFHRNVSLIIKGISAELLGLDSDYVEKYEKAVADELADFSVSLRSDISPRIQEVSRERLLVFRAISHRLRDMKLSMDAQQKVFYAQMKLVLFPLFPMKEMHHMESHEATTIYTSFIEHLRSDWTAVIELLALADEIDKLEVLNREFQMLEIKRDQDRSEVVRGHVVKCREETDTLYRLLMLHIGAKALETVFMDEGLVETVNFQTEDFTQESNIFDDVRTRLGKIEDKKVRTALACAYVVQNINSLIARMKQYGMIK